MDYLRMIIYLVFSIEFLINFNIRVLAGLNPQFFIFTIFNHMKLTRLLLNRYEQKI